MKIKSTWSIMRENKLTIKDAEMAKKKKRFKKIDSKFTSFQKLREFYEYMTSNARISLSSEV